MRNTNAKYVIVFALLISVIGLTIGFATYTNTLTIQSSADVKGDPSKFNVKLSTVSTGYTPGTVAGVTNPTGVTGFTAANATIVSSGDSAGRLISGLKATFTDVGQKVTYKLYAYNGGSFVAYLNSISGITGGKTCTAISGTTQSLVDQACNGISVKVTIGGTNGTGGITYSADNTSISSHSLAKNTGEEVFITIEYASNSQVADGDFTVSFDPIVILYGSAD